MEDDAVFPAHARRLSDHTREWLVALQQNARHHQHFTIKHALQILVGLWVCERAFVNKSEFPCTQAHIRWLALYLATHTTITADLLQIDPALVLLATGILRFFNAPIASFEQFAGQISQVLQAHTDQDETEANELYMVRLLLQRLQLHPPLPACSLREIPALALIQADDATVQAFTISLAAATDYGQNPDVVDPLYRQQLHVLLPILVIDYLRRYQLEPGMKILRHIRYLNASLDITRSTSLCACYRFLCEQQLPDGRFGFFEQEIARLHDLAQERDADLDVYLPYSISFLWCVAEAVHPHFILVRSIG